MDLNELHTFYWVAKSSGFTGAARVLALPKSTVSRQIASLEQRLGARLIERTTRRTALTEVGQLFLAHCEQIVGEVEEAEQVVTSYNSAPRGLLRVGLPVTFARSFLTPTLPSFCRKYPEVKIELVMGGGRLESIGAPLDVVIQVGRLEDSSYVVRKLGSMTQGLHAAPSYLKQRSPLDTIADLAQHNVIMLSRSPAGTRWQLTGPGGEKGEIRLDPYLAVADPVIAHHLAAAGLGIALLPDFLTRKDKSLVPVLPNWQPEPLGFFALYRARKMTPPKLRAFLDELEANLQF